MRCRCRRKIWQDKLGYLSRGCVLCTFHGREDVRGETKSEYRSRHNNVGSFGLEVHEFGSCVCACVCFASSTVKLILSEISRQNILSISLLQACWVLSKIWTSLPRACAAAQLCDIITISVCEGVIVTGNDAAVPARGVRQSQPYSIPRIVPPS